MTNSISSRLAPTDPAATGFRGSENTRVDAGEKPTTEVRTEPRKAGAPTTEDRLAPTETGGARPRSALNGAMTATMSGLKKAGLVALSVAVLAGAAFVGYQQLGPRVTPDPAPIVVPVEPPAVVLPAPGLKPDVVLPTAPTQNQPPAAVPGLPGPPGGSPVQPPPAPPVVRPDTIPAPVPNTLDGAGIRPGTAPVFELAPRPTPLHLEAERPAPPVAPVEVRPSTVPQRVVPDAAPGAVLERAPGHDRIEGAPTTFRPYERPAHIFRPGES